jgi:hypothetical protein
MSSSVLVLSNLIYLAPMQTFCNVILNYVSFTEVDIAKQYEQDGQAALYFNESMYTTK